LGLFSIQKFAFRILADRVLKPLLLSPQTLI
jgi:hypothetical protein